MIDATPSPAPAAPAIQIRSPRQKKALQTIIATGAAVCLAASAGGYLLGVRPAIAAIAAENAVNADLAEKQRQTDDAARKLQSTRNRLAEANRAVAALPLRLEPAAAANLRLNRLAEVAQASGVLIDVMQPQAVVDGPHYQTVPIRVAGNGPYQACAAFLHAVRAQFPDVTIQSFEAINGSPGRGANNASFRIDLAWHTTPARK